MRGIHEVLGHYFAFDKAINPALIPSKKNRSEDPWAKELFSEEYRVIIPCQFLHDDPMGGISITAYSIFNQFDVKSEERALDPLGDLYDSAYIYYGIFLNAAAHIYISQFGDEFSKVRSLRVVDMANGNKVHAIKYKPIYAEMFLEHQKTNPKLRSGNPLVLPNEMYEQEIKFQKRQLQFN
jgi:hypothetical protein